MRSENVHLYKSFFLSATVPREVALQGKLAYLAKYETSDHGGLCYPSEPGFELILGLTHVYIYVMSRDVLIVFNKLHPAALLETKLYNNHRMRQLFFNCLSVDIREGRGMTSVFEDETTGVAELWRDVLQGFFRTFNKDK